MWTESVVSVAPMASSAIMTNNLSVSFITFAGGIVFGLGTFFALFLERHDAGRHRRGLPPLRMSLALGALLPRTARWNCLPSSSPARGLPPRPRHALSRRAALEGIGRPRRHRSHALVSGIIPLLVIAGLLEGFFSPSHAPVWLKFTVGGLLFTCSTCGSSGP